MSRFLWIIIILALFYMGRWFYHTMESTNSRLSGSTTQDREAARPAAAVLPGMPASLETSLSAAKKQGPEALRTFLWNYRRHIQDPRLAEIELDYVILVSRQDPAEARRVFQALRQRVSPSSPLHERVKSLEKTFE